jgi:hypothetical protein
VKSEPPSSNNTPLPIVKTNTNAHLNASSTPKQTVRMRMVSLSPSPFSLLPSVHSLTQLAPRASTLNEMDENILKEIKRAEEMRAAIRLQKLWRGHRQRLKYKRLRVTFIRMQVILNEKKQKKK